MPSWNPSYRLSDELEARGFLGVTGTNSTVGDMIVTLAQLGVAYHSPHLGRFFPEALLGAEFWSRSEGGVYTAGTFNVHYSLKLGEPGTVLGALSTATIGYSVVRVPARTAHHATLGLRFSL